MYRNAEPEGEPGPLRSCLAYNAASNAEPEGEPPLVDADSDGPPQVDADSDGPPPLVASSCASPRSSYDSSSDAEADAHVRHLRNRLEADLRTIVREDMVQCIDLSTLSNWLHAQTPRVLIAFIQQAGQASWPSSNRVRSLPYMFRYHPAQAGQATLTQSNWNSIVLRGAIADFMRLYERSTRTMFLGELIPRALLGWALLGWYHLIYYVD